MVSIEKPSLRTPAPALRGRRGSQHGHEGRADGREVASTGPSGSARIATTPTRCGRTPPRRPAPALRGRRGSQLTWHTVILRAWNPAPALRGRRGSQHPIHSATSTQPVSQHRPFGVGEDRNVVVGEPVDVLGDPAPALRGRRGSQQRLGDGQVADQVRPAPALRGRRGSQLPEGSGNQCAANATPAPALRGRRGSQRLSAPQDERRNIGPSTGPSGSARIATAVPPETSRRFPVRQHRPFGVGEDRNLSSVATTISASSPAPALRGRRGSQRRGDDEPHRRIPGQHRPFGVGEDRNPIKVSSASKDTTPAPALRGRRGSQPRTVRECGPVARTPAPALRGRRGSQPLLVQLPADVIDPSTGPSGSARIATSVTR